MPQYLNNENTEFSIRLTLTEEGRAFLEEKGEEFSSTATNDELWEHQLCNGWSKIDPKDIGALTEANIYSDDDGKTIYSDINFYQTRSIASIILERGFCILPSF